MDSGKLFSKTLLNYWGQMYSKDVIFKQVLNQLHFESYSISLVIRKKYIAYLRERHSYLSFFFSLYLLIISRYNGEFPLGH